MAKTHNIEDLKNHIAKLEQEKNQLLKMVSHDVKSPFNKLYALSNLLQLVSENLNEEQLDYLTRMEWVIKEGLTVVRNLMDLRAIDNNEIDLNPEELRLDAILGDNFKNFSKQIETKKIKIESNLSKVTMQSDKRLLEKVVDNLVSNAVKFTPKERSIKVNLNTDNAKIELRISSDSGPIPAEEVDNLFKRSSPLSTRPTHGESALGNGLFIAQAYANKLGGNITFNQKGSRIEFTLFFANKVS